MDSYAKEILWNNKDYFKGECTSTVFQAAFCMAFPPLMEFKNWKGKIKYILLSLKKQGVDLEFILVVVISCDCTMY